MWSAIELNVAIVCACLMVSKPLISRFLPTLFSRNLSDYDHRLSHIHHPNTTSSSRDGTRTRTTQLSGATAVAPEPPADFIHEVASNADNVQPMGRCVDFSHPQKGHGPSLGREDVIDTPATRVSLSLVRAE